MRTATANADNHKSIRPAMPDALTAIERRVYHYLLDFLAENTYQPSIREIARRFRIPSTKSVVDILQSLALKGYIERQTGRSRGVRLLGFSSVGRTQPVPLYRTVNGREPVLADEHRERFITMDRAFVPADEAYFLRMDDEGMRDRCIQPGDLVLVNPGARAREGESVAVRLGNRTTVRALSHRGPQLLLTPAASGSELREVIVGPGDDFAVLGTVAAVLRNCVDNQRADEDLQHDVSSPAVVPLVT